MNTQDKTVSIPFIDDQLRDGTIDPDDLDYNWEETNEQTSEQQEGQVSQDTSPEPSEAGLEEAEATPVDMGTQPKDQGRRRRREPDYIRVTKSPLKEGDLVDLVIDGKIYATTKVVTVLSKQFIVTVNGKDRFYFYEDRGVTWQHIQQSQ